MRSMEIMLSGTFVEKLRTIIPELPKHICDLTLTAHNKDVVKITMTFIPEYNLVDNEDK